MHTIVYFLKFHEILQFRYVQEFSFIRKSYFFKYLTATTQYAKILAQVLCGGRILVLGLTYPIPGVVLVESAWDQNLPG